MLIAPLVASISPFGGRWPRKELVSFRSFARSGFDLLQSRPHIGACGWVRAGATGVKSDYQALIRVEAARTALEAVSGARPRAIYERDVRHTGTGNGRSRLELKAAVG